MLKLICLQFLLIFWMPAQTNAGEYFSYIADIKYGESAAGDLVLMGQSYKWSTCCDACKDANAGYNAVTLSNVGECYCSLNSMRVANESRMMSVMTTWSDIDLDGNWGAWIPTSDCWPPCGQGSQTRTRTCTFPNNINAGASSCHGAATDTTFCFNRCAPYVEIISEAPSTQIKPGVPFNTNIKVPYISYAPGNGETTVKVGTSETTTERAAFEVQPPAGEEVGSQVTNSGILSRVESDPTEKGFKIWKAFTFTNLGSSFITGHSETYYFFSCKASVKLTDAPELNDGRRFFQSFSLALSSTYYHVELQFYTKDHNPADEGEIQFEAENFFIDEPSNAIGTMGVFLVNLNVVPDITQQSTNIEITLHYPHTTVEPERTRPYSDIAQGISYTTNYLKNTAKVHVSYFGILKNKHIRFYYRVTATDYSKTGYPNQERQMKVHVTYNYCPYDVCDSTKLRKSGSMDYQTTIHSMYYPFYHPFRLKFLDEGLCLSGYNENNVYTVKSTCDTKFQLTKNADIFLIGNSDEGNFFGITRVTLENGTEAFAFKPLQTAWNPHEAFFLKPLGDSVCLYNAKTSYEFGIAVQHAYGQIFRADSLGRYNDAVENQCKLDRSKVKVLEGWSNSKDIILRSILKITVPLGEKLIVCNPKGDLGNKRNCYFTFNRGLSWTAVSPMATFFTFFIPSTNCLYGYCNRRTAPCKLRYSDTGSMLMMVTGAEYQENSIKVESQMVENFDSIDYTTTVEVTQSDPLVGVSSIGLHSRTSESASWQRMLLWSE